MFEAYGERSPPSRPNADYTNRSVVVGRDRRYSGAGREEDNGRKSNGIGDVDRKRRRTGTKNIKPGTALVYEPPLENLP